MRTELNGFQIGKTYAVDGGWTAKLVHIRQPIASNPYPFVFIHFMPSGDEDIATHHENGMRYKNSRHRYDITSNESIQ